MEINSDSINGVRVLKIDGNLKSSEELGMFTKEVEQAVADGITKLLLNFEDVNFVTSSGLGRIVMAVKKMDEINGSLRISNLGKDLDELFTYTRLKDKIAVSDTQAEALDGF